MNVELVYTLSEYSEEYDKCKAMLSKYDKELNKVYHDIEQINFNASEGYYLSKKVQELRSKRRVVKQKMYEINRSVEIFRDLKGTGEQILETLITRASKIKDIDNNTEYLALARKYGYDKLEEEVDADLYLLEK